MSHQSFQTTTIGLRRASPPWRLFEKAKRLGIWNPSDIDFRQDREDWRRLNAEEQDLLLRLTAMFQAGEEAVTLDLLPLIQTIAREGRLEEEMFLTTFLFEEAKHVDFFNRFLIEVVGSDPDLGRFHTDSYKEIFYKALPEALNQLENDPSPEAQVKASVTYNMVVEGMLAETGYYSYFKVLEAQNLMPGQRQGITLLKQDESRHIAYGIYLISRLLVDDHGLWAVVEDTMNDLLDPAIGVIADAFAAYDIMPFGLDESDFIDYALSQLQKRIARLEKAKDSTFEEVVAISQAIIDNDDG